MRLFSLALLSSAALCLASPHHLSADIAPLHVPDVVSTDLIADSYIVVFKDDVNADAIDSHVDFVKLINSASPLHGVESGLKHVWNSQVIKGYAGTFSREVVEMIRRQPEVAYVEADQAVYASGYETQEAAPWGLGRISQRKKVSFFPTYEYVKKGGQGITVYVLDTGVYINHTEFEGRAHWGVTIPKDEPDIDRTGHGTHVAGTIASKTYGVAKHAEVVSVKILTTEYKGSGSDLIAGLKWAVEDASRQQAKAEAELKANNRTSYKGSIINMSLGTPGVSVSINNATDNAVKAGVHVVVAAGNNDDDACRHSPASVQSVFTVAASSVSEERLVISNYGKCVDIFAPGDDIESTNRTGGSETRLGTSMASPHVAGLIAYFLSIYPHETFNPVLEAVPNRAAHDVALARAYGIAYDALPVWISRVLPSPTLFKTDVLDEVSPKVFTPAEMKKAILDLATKGAIRDAEGSPNLLAFNNATDSGTGW